MWCVGAGLAAVGRCGGVRCAAGRVGCQVAIGCGLCASCVALSAKFYVYPNGLKAEKLLPLKEIFYCVRLLVRVKSNKNHMTYNFAFIDESGNHDLVTEKVGVSNYFIVLAVLTDSSKIDNLRKSVDKIRITHFGKENEIKSNGVNDDRILKIIEDVRLLDFNFYAIAIKKDEIFKESGLQYKKSFIKYINNKLYSVLFRHFDEVQIFADGHGGSEFTESFKKYINDRRVDLFSNAKFEILDRKKEVLIQLADFMVGTIAKIYENRISEYCKEKFSLFIKEKCIKIDEWPLKFEGVNSFPILTSTSNSDSIVQSIAVNIAVNFLKINENNFGEHVKQQRVVLEYLIFNAMFNDDSGFISTAEIVEHVRSFGFDKITNQSLRSGIIAKLRDSNVLIASSGKGYKIPTTYKDMLTFAELVNDHALPLLSRLSRARTTIKLASNGNTDFLNHSKFKKLRNIIESNEL